MNKVTKLCFAFMLSFISIEDLQAQDIQRVRVDFETPTGFVRHLLLGFTPNNAASDGADYGYDALNIEDREDDLNWMIEDLRYVIQGVGEFDESKSYPFGLFLSNSGEIKISLDSLENFNNPIDVYIYDANQNLFHKINDSSFSMNIGNGEYLNRLFITFQNTDIPASAVNGALSINSYDNLNKTIVKSIPNTKEVINDTRSDLLIKKVEILDILGKKVTNLKKVNNSSVRIPAQHINSKIIIVSVFTNKGVIRKKLLLN